eukprot:GFUD01015938.1.p1 GENE.GFUD01015938.1~~GFUD01015938.1.p1  ORF type:complete len:884 (-),score=289.89 GFUD01015938.1:28-2679(-)
MDMMTFILLFIHCVFPSVNSIPSSVLDLSELSFVQYSMKIDKEPVVEVDIKDSSLSDPSLTMVNVAGQKYRCSLPQVPDSVTEKNGEDFELDIAKLLSPLETAPCMFLTKEWWTYEVCYKRAIKQYHVEGDVPVGAVIVLGVHNPALDRWEVSNKTYQPQWYGNGSRCELTDKLRQTEVRFVCNEAAGMEFIGDIVEHQSCEYRVVVHTSKLCGVPWLRTVQDTTPLPIVCQPVLPQLEMEKYQLFQERSKLAKRLQQHKRKQDQSLQLVKELGPRGIATAGFGTVDSMGEVIGDKMMEKVFNEVDTLLGNSLDIFVFGRDKTSEVGSGKTSVSSSKRNVDKKLNERWDYPESIGHKVTKASLHGIIAKRNILLDRISEAGKTLEQFKAELMATERNLFHLKPSEENKEEIRALEIKWRSLHMTIGSIQEHVAKLDSKAKRGTRSILFLKNKLKGERNLKEVVSDVKDSQFNFMRDQIRARKSLQAEDVHKVSEDVNLPVEKGSYTTTEVNEGGQDTVQISTSSTDNEDQISEEDVFGENIKISFTKLAPAQDHGHEDEFDEGEAEKIVAKLEGLIKHKLSGHGLAESGKVVQVKLITARLPEGTEDDEDWRMQGMFYNMMTGNLLGFEDIDSVMRDEENYGFIWREEMLNNIDKMIFSLREDGVDTDLDNNMSDYAISQDEDIFNYWKERNKGQGVSFQTNDGVKEVALKVVNNDNENEGKANLVVESSTKDKNEVNDDIENKRKAESLVTASKNDNSPVNDNVEIEGNAERVHEIAKMANLFAENAEIVEEFEKLINLLAENEVNAEVLDEIAKMLNEKMADLISENEESIDESPNMQNKVDSDALGNADSVDDFSKKDDDTTANEENADSIEESLNKNEL